MISFQQWIGKKSSAVDTLALTPANALAASLNRPALAIGDNLPPLWHWLFFLPLSQQSQLGLDGHTSSNGFMPPVPLPRRMWAGSRLQFRQALHIGEAVRRESRIIDIAEKKGRSGALVLVSVQHEIYGVNGLAITEEQDIVYRPAPSTEALSKEAPSTESPLTKAFSTKAEPVAPVNPPAQNTNAQWSHERSADTVLLFRYSALTFNAHRIHYDYPYTTQVEGYPDLIVHGPLLFTLLVDALLQEYPTVQIESLRVRAMRPLFCNRPFRLQGQLAPDRQQAQLWSLDESGYVTMHVDVVLHADKEN